MRRPSLGHNEDEDLSRLTTNSTGTNESISTNLQQNGNDANNHSTNNHNHHHQQQQQQQHSQSQYLPNIINSHEWQNCRKRKERQDSTSSTTQDRKLVRSNSEECVPNSQEVIRRVSSHEDFKKPPLLEKNGNNNVVAVKEEKSCAKQAQKLCDEILEPVTEGVEMNIEVHVVERASTSVDRSPAPPKPYDLSPRYQRLSPNRDSRLHSKRNEGEHHNECENERRRERFSRARAPPGRKSPRKPSSKHVSGSSGGSSGSSVQSMEHDENVYKFDEKYLKHERRGFVSQRDDDNKVAQLPDHNDNTVADMNANNKTSVANEQVPWNQSFPDDNTPVVCQRFAGQAFNYINTMEKFIKPRSVPTKTFGSSSNSSISSSGSFGLKREIMDKAPPSSMYLLPEERLKQIYKRLASLKKKMAQYEEKFELETGYRPSRADKMADKSIRNAVTEIEKLRKEKTQLKSDPLASLEMNKVANVTQLSGESKLAEMRETLEEIEKRLQVKRTDEGRNVKLEDLSFDQLIEEKTSVQRGLLYLESIYGRPSTREERDAARPLYDRYRMIKRMINRNNSLSGSGFGGIAELPTILENEAMAFTGIDVTPPSLPASLVQSPSDASANNSTDSTETTTSSSNVNENIHGMSFNELVNYLDATRDEKKELRRKIKEFEHDFEEINGRKMLKSDRKAMDDTYAAYKQKKAKLRLLDALVKKHLADLNN